MAENVDIEEICSITRKPRGRGFEYFDKNRLKIRSRGFLRYVKNLAIPPMWQDVGISTDQQYRIQAIGYDVKKRKQYIYHPDWVAQQQAQKFAKLLDFSQALPHMRGLILKNSEQPTWNIEKVAALATRILDETGIRIGNKQYSQQNETFGLTTLRRKHLNSSDDFIELDFKGKHGQRRRVTIEDTQLVSLIESSAEKPGYSLLRYKESGKWYDLTSDEVNQYIRSISGADFTSKDFRTWAGTRLAVEYAAECEYIVSQYPRKRFKSTLVKKVAGALGNTPAICEKYYIHPKVLEYLIAMDKKGQSVGPCPHAISNTSELSECEQLAQTMIQGNSPLS